MNIDKTRERSRLSQERLEQPLCMFAWVMFRPPIYQTATVKPNQNRDQLSFSSIPGEIKPTEKEASKLPQILMKIGRPDLQPKNAGFNTGAPVIVIFYEYTAAKRPRQGIRWWCVYFSPSIEN